MLFVRKTLASAVLALACTHSVNAATANWLGGNGDYDDPLLWDTNPLIPLNGNGGQNYDVTIGTDNSRVTYDTGAAGVVDSLNLASGVRFDVSGAGSVFSALGGNIDFASLRALSGGVIQISGITSYTGRNTGIVKDNDFVADGSGSLLDLSTLTTVVRNGGSSSNNLSINASAGGIVDLGGISAFSDSANAPNGRINITANGVGSVVRLPGVTAIDDAKITVRDGGEVTGALQTLTNSELVQRSTGIIDVSALADGTESRFIVEDGGFLDLGTTDIDGGSLIVRKGTGGSGGGTLQTSITSFVSDSTGILNDNEFSADGAGSLLDVSSITSFVRSGGSNSNNVIIEATDGGTVDFSGITGFTNSANPPGGRINILANGAGSVVMLPGVTAVDNVKITVRDGGEVTGQLQSFTNGELIQRSTGILDVSALTDGTESSFIVEDGGFLDLGTTDIDGGSLIVRKGTGGSGGGTLQTSVTSFVSDSTGILNDNQFSADGAGSLLDVSSITSFVRSGGSNSNNVIIEATDGGTVDFSGLTAFTDSANPPGGRINILANGAGSVVMLPGVSAIDNAKITVRDGGEVTGQLHSFTNGELIQRSTGIIDISMLTDGTDTSFVVEDGGFLDLGTTNYNGGSLVVREGAFGAGGGTLQTSVTSFIGDDAGILNDNEFSAEGAGSVLDVSSITSIERSGGSNSNNLIIAASEGGTVDFSGISGFADNNTGVNGRMDISAASGGTVDISGVSSIDNADITVEETGVVVLDSLAAIAETEIIVESSAGAGASDIHLADSFSMDAASVINLEAAEDNGVVIGPGAGPAAAAAVNILGGTLTAGGTILGDLVNDGGTVAPGTSPGVLSVSGDYTQTGGTLAIEIGGLLAGDEFDLLDIGGIADISGATLSLALVNGFAPSLGDTFVFLQAAGVNAAFDNVVCSNCGAVAFGLNIGADFASLTVISVVPIPASLPLFAGAFAALAALRRRRALRA